MALFISFLDGRNLSPATILCYLSAIGYIHKMKGLHDPAKAFLIQELLTSLSRQKSCDVRLPISLNLSCMTSYALSSTPTLRQHSVYFFSAMFLTAFYGFFRFGELAARSACHTTVITGAQPSPKAGTGLKMQTVRFFNVTLLGIYR